MKSSLLGLLQLPFNSIQSAIQLLSLVSLKSVSSPKGKTIFMNDFTD